MIILIFIFGCQEQEPQDHAGQVCLEDGCFYMELAATSADRADGLMFRESLADDRCMFFLFQYPAVHPFWMKNTLIPLDIVWTNSSDHVIYIEKNAQPCENDPCPTYGPGIASKYVIEVNAGTIMETEVGDKITFNRATFIRRFDNNY